MIQIRNHVITQGTIEGPQLLEAIEKFHPDGVDWCYTDPPWGDGNLKYWQTINKKMTNANVTQLSQHALERRIADIITLKVRNYAFIVYGVKQADSLMQELKQSKNVTDVQCIQKKYKAGNKWLPNCTICVTLNKAPVVDWEPILTGKNGRQSLYAVCERFQDVYPTCLEMFIGIGHYLKALDHYGFTVIGNELNAARLKKAISKI